MICTVESTNQVESILIQNGKCTSGILNFTHLLQIAILLVLYEVHVQHRINLYISIRWHPYVIVILVDTLLILGINNTPYAPSLVYYFTY